MRSEDNERWVRVGAALDAADRSNATGCRCLATERGVAGLTAAVSMARLPRIDARSGAPFSPLLRNPAEIPLIVGWLPRSVFSSPDRARRAPRAVRAERDRADRGSVHAYDIQQRRAIEPSYSRRIWPKAVSCTVGSGANRHSEDAIAMLPFDSSMFDNSGRTNGHSRQGRCRNPRPRRDAALPRHQRRCRGHTRPATSGGTAPS